MDENIEKELTKGNLVVLKTDTIYGIVCLARDSIAVKKLYAVRQRTLTKPCIILVSGVDDIPFSDVLIRRKYGQLSDEKPTTIVLDVDDDFLPHLPRNNGTLAFRVPKSTPQLIKLLKKTGALLAPSANIQGQPPAKNIHEARKYFGDNVAQYIDGGEVMDAEPSRIVKIVNGEIIKIR